MGTDQEPNRKPRLPIPVTFFYGWVVVALAFVAALSSAGIRSALPVFINPLEAEFGWSRSAISWAGGLALLLYGGGAPLTGWLLDRFGPRKVMMGGLTILGLGVAGTVLMQEFWHLILFWGIVIGTGAAGLSSVLAASVAHRWFVARRGLALGILNGASSTGQLIFIPLLMMIVVKAGWRAGSMVLVASALGTAALIRFWMRNDPSDVGLQPFGAEAAGSSAAQSGLASKQQPAPIGIREATKHSTFWLLCGCFFVCGGTANGLVGLHLIPHAIDRGIPEINAAWTVGVMGSMNIIGTLLSGWLTDRMDTRKLLALVFALRGASLFILPYVTDFSGLFVFAVIYGLDWFATVPPVIHLTGNSFGKQSIGRIYGWIFLSHQIGAFVSAIGAGTVFDWVGAYEPAFLSGGFMGFAAAVMALSIRSPELIPPLRPGQPGAQPA